MLMLYRQPNVNILKVIFIFILHTHTHTILNIYRWSRGLKYENKIGTVIKFFFHN